MLHVFVIAYAIFAVLLGIGNHKLENHNGSQESNHLGKV